MNAFCKRVEHFDVWVGTKTLFPFQTGVKNSVEGSYCTTLQAVQQTQVFEDIQRDLQFVYNSSFTTTTYYCSVQPLVAVLLDIL